MLVHMPQLNQKATEEKQQSYDENNWESSDNLRHFPCLQRVVAHLTHSDGITWGADNILLVLADPLLAQNTYGRDGKSEGEADEVEDVDLNVVFGRGECIDERRVGHWRAGVGELEGKGEEESVGRVGRVSGKVLKRLYTECGYGSGE